MPRVVLCESCGAPLDAPWKQIVVTCGFCGVQNLPGQPQEPVPSSMPADGRPRLNIGGRTYLVEGRIARGDSCDVFRARWVRRLGERVVIKVLRARSDGDLLRRETRLLELLHASPSQGAEHFARLLPRPIAMGPVHSERHGERLCSVFQDLPGFAYSLVDVGQTWPLGVDGRIVAWIAKRVLELLAWVHRAGVVHGAVLPPHVLVHPREHGAVLVGWSAAVTRSEQGWAPLPALSRQWSPFYPDRSRTGRVLDRAVDVGMACRCALAAWGEYPGAPKVPDAVCGELARVLREAAEGRQSDAWAVREAVDRAAASQFGPPTYSPLGLGGPVQRRIRVD